MTATQISNEEIVVAITLDVLAGKGWFADEPDDELVAALRRLYGAHPVFQLEVQFTGGVLHDTLAARPGQYLAGFYEQERQEEWERTGPTWTCDCGSTFKAPRRDSRPRRRPFLPDRRGRPPRPAGRNGPWHRDHSQQGVPALRPRSSPPGSSGWLIHSCGCSWRAWHDDRQLAQRRDDGGDHRGPERRVAGIPEQLEAGRRARHVAWPPQRARRRAETTRRAHSPAVARAGLMIEARVLSRGIVAHRDPLEHRGTPER
ncbi:MAG: hypothetical protein ACLP01_28505, partial [Solirubrobacteraceae bacterium]